MKNGREGLSFSFFTAKKVIKKSIRASRNQEVEKKRNKTKQTRYSALHPERKEKSHAEKELQEKQTARG